MRKSMISMLADPMHKEINDSYVCGPLSIRKAMIAMLAADASMAPLPLAL